LSVQHHKILPIFKAYIFTLSVFQLWPKFDIFLSCVFQSYGSNICTGRANSYTMMDSFDFTVDLTMCFFSRKYYGFMLDSFNVKEFIQEYEFL